MKVKKWVKELHSMVGTNIAIAICGNKIDKEREKVVDLKEAEKYDCFLFLLLFSFYFFKLFCFILLFFKFNLN